MRLSTVTFGTILALSALLWAPSVHGEDGLVVDEAGNVGIGTDAPSALLNVKGDGARVLVEETGENQVLFTLKRPDTAAPVRFELARGTVSWTFDNRGEEFTILRAGNAIACEFELDDQGNLTVAGTVSGGSSKTIKTDFEAVDEREVLEKVVALPVLEWRYKTAPESQRHVGPMAEDFHEAFGVSNGKSISMVDANGVAFAAIKGLHRVIQERDAEIAALRSQNEEFGVRLARLEEQARGAVG